MGFLPSGGGGGLASPGWEALTLNPVLASEGAPFAPTVQCAMYGDLLVFRGLISVPGGAGSGFWLATLPAGFPAPAFTRRALGGQGSTVVHLNLNTDRTIVTASGISSNWVSLDSTVVALP